MTLKSRKSPKYEGEDTRWREKGGVHTPKSKYEPQVCPVCKRTDCNCTKCNGTGEV